MKNNQLSYLGVGLEWDVRLEDQLWDQLKNLDVLEIIPENFTYAGQLQLLDSLDKIAASNVPVMIHGVELSIGSSDPLKKQHIHLMQQIMERVNTVCYSEHLSMVEAGATEIGQLTPLMWSRELADRISEKVVQVQEIVDVPFMLENVTNRFVFPRTEISETEFINRILRNTGCGLLLDVTNVFTNATNHGFDPYQWIREIDMAYVQQIHLAGGEYDSDGVLQDSHDNSVFEESWKLYDYALKHLGRPVSTIVERTGNIPDIQSLLDEVGRAKALIEQETFCAVS